MKVKVLCVIVISIIVSACASIPPTPDYKNISKNIDGNASVIVGSLTETSLPIANVFALVDKLDSKSFSEETAFKKRLLHKVELTPGEHQIQVSANQAARTGIHEFTLNAKKGKTYVVRFEVEDHEYGTIWIENYNSGELATKKVRIKRPLVRSMILLI